MSESFPGPKSLGRKVKVELDLSNYATKTDLKNARGVDTSSFTKKTHLAYLKTDLSSLKSKVDKLDVDKLLPASVDLSKLSDVVNNDVVKKDIMLRWKILKIKCLILLTYLLKLLLMLNQRTLKVNYLVLLT